MNRDEFFEKLNSTDFDNKLITAVEEAYDVQLDDLIKRMVSISNEQIFLDNEIRLLDYAEILHADIEFDVDFKSHGLIPLFDCFDNDYISYDYKHNCWCKYNIIDNVYFSVKASLFDLL